MEIILNLISGLIGALIGAFATIYVYKHSQKILYRKVLIDKIDFLDFQLRRYENDSSNVYKIFKESFLDLQSAFFIFNQYSCHSKKETFRNAWYEFKGQDPDHKEHGHEYMHFPSSRDEAFNKLKKFRDAIANT